MFTKRRRSSLGNSAAARLKRAMGHSLRALCQFIFVVALTLYGFSSFASEWRTIELAARPLNIAESNGVLWVCGSDEFIASSDDGGKTWTTRHSSKNGGLLLTIGFANEHFGFAAGTVGAILITKDGGESWDSVKVPSQLVYDVAFSDEKHGLIQAPRTIYTTADGGTTWAEVRIDLDSEELQGFSQVLEVVAPSTGHQAIVLSEGNSSVYDYRLFITKDAGRNWRVQEIPSTGLGRLTAHGGEYWFAGMEVIEKDKPGGGYGVPLVMHSSDGENWTHVTRWSKHEFSECNTQGCLYWDGLGVQLPPANPISFWTFAPEKVVTAKWAVGKGSICTVGTALRCAPATTTQTIPPYSESSAPIAPLLAPPPLDAPPAQGLQCLYCDFEQIMVTSDFQGAVEVELHVHIKLDGLVQRVEVARTSNKEIGERLAATAENWIFVPYVSDGVARPVDTKVTLRVQAIKSK